MMKEIIFDEILKYAEFYYKNNIVWHHHFLTPRCVLNEGEYFKIILENEENGESFMCLFNEKPMKELELLENLFFGRDK